MTETDKKRFCKRCLLREVPEGEELAKIVEERIALMPAEKRAPQEIWWRRLEHCRRCDHLNSGTCGLCGCYAELRTAQKNRRCPDVPPKWMEVPAEE